MTDLSDHTDPAESHDEAPQDLEPILMAVWRRVMEEGCGPELSVTEAAAVLGTSVASVRRRIASGAIPAYRDVRGRVRIVPRIPLHHSDPDAPESISMVSRLMEDLRSTRQQLHQVTQDKTRLEKELETAETAIALTQEELTAMWRLLSARSSEETLGSSRKRASASKLSGDVSSGVSNDVTKIQSQIMAVRKLARRRKWPWALVS